MNLICRKQKPARYNMLQARHDTVSKSNTDPSFENNLKEILKTRRWKNILYILQVNQPAEGNVGLCSNVQYIERSEPQAVRVEKLRARARACFSKWWMSRIARIRAVDSGLRIGPGSRP